MTNYTADDWARMQNNAENRVKQAQQYADHFIESKPEHKQSPPKAQPKQKKGILSLLNFDGLEWNGDTSTILMLLALLGKDSKQDDLLILALLYIML